MRENRHKTPGRDNARLTIGYLTPALHAGYMDQWAGVVDAAQRHDVNLISFPGWCLRDSRGFQAQANILYNLVNAENLDGVVSWTSSIGNYVDAEEIRAFHERYRPLPMVSIGRTVEGFPSLLMDSYRSMREAIVHMIEVHGYRRLVFVRGPEGHFDAQERYRAYVETLEAYDIPFDPDLVTPSLQWGFASGRALMQLLLDERKLRPQTDFEAIVASNDYLLIGALEILQARNVRIPGDVAAVGFDDIVEGRTSTPPLTSVPAPYYRLGYRAVETLLALLEGEQPPEKVIVPSKLVVRQSCGCLDPAVVQAAAEPRPSASPPPAKLRSTADPVKAGREEFEAALATQREGIVTAMTQAAEELEGEIDPAGAERLLDSFAAELGGDSAGAFMAALDEVLRQAVTTDGDVPVWHGALSALRRFLLPYLDGEALSQAEDLWQQARVAIEEAAQRVQAYQQLQAERQAQTLREIGTTLITTFHVGELMNVLVEGLPHLGIPSAYLSLYQDPQPYAYPDPAPEWSQLLLAYADPPHPADTPHPGDASGPRRVEVSPEEGRFPSRQLLPAGALPQERRYAMVVEPLHFRENQIGFALFEVGPRRGRVYEALRGWIGSALYGAFLLQERQRAEAALTQAYADVGQLVEERTRELQQEIVERRRAEKELERYREHLEDLVAERTQELKEAQAELIRRERLSALGQLTATVAHEVRNPLSTVRTSVFAIGDAIERDEMERVDRALQLAERNIVRCDNIISELLDYTRDQVLQKSPTDIDRWSEGVLDELTIPEGIACIRDLKANVEVPIDSEHLRRAITNVVNNAVDAMQEARTKRLTVSTRVVGEKLEIRIGDTGCGIPDEVKEKLFEPLVSTKSFGVGLGLPIVKSIMEQHGGGVEISSQADVGTTVVLWLPMAKGGSD